MNSSCIGASNKIKTKRGIILILNLKVGDFVKTRSGWSKIFYIRNHGFVPISHFNFFFESGSHITLTKEHLVYDLFDRLKRADELKIGDTIFGSSEKIVKITKNFRCAFDTLCSRRRVIHRRFF